MTDAFFSLPRGGAEIGGVLLGRQERGAVTIVDSMPLDCEHAFGPSFVLSPRDQTKLAELILTGKQSPDTKPVGWYHSHTRSEIFLSDADQEIHNRFFPEPWQVALVLKPHTFQPMRAGFFFRERDGSIHGAATYREFVLDPLPVRPAPSHPSFDAAPSPPLGVEPEPNGPVINVASVVESEPEPESAPELEWEAPAPIAAPVEPTRPAPAPLARAEMAAPDFATVAPTPPRRWVGWVAVALGLAAGAVAYETRGLWLPGAEATPTPAISEPLALNVIDQNGQLQIRWNGAVAVRRSTGNATLVIDDGPTPLSVSLDSAHLQAGSFTYARQGDRVDVSLTLRQADGKVVREATAYARNSAPSPQQQKPAEDGALRQERDTLAREHAKLKADFARQVERNKLLEKALAEMRKVIQRDDQRKRLDHQVPDTVK